jgi:D-hydroxyproline dehydrogenase subunit gamma
MKDRRIFKGVKRGPSFAIDVDGENLTAYPGETIASVLYAAGWRTFRKTESSNQSRGMFCGIGLCGECRMVIDGVPNVRACQTPAVPGCRVETQLCVGVLKVEY